MAIWKHGQDVGFRVGVLGSLRGHAATKMSQAPIPKPDMIISPLEQFNVLALRATSACSPTHSGSRLLLAAWQVSHPFFHGQCGFTQPSIVYRLCAVPKDQIYGQLGAAHHASLSFLWALGGSLTDSWAQPSLTGSSSLSANLSFIHGAASF